MGKTRSNSISRANKLFAQLPPERQNEALQFLSLLAVQSFIPAKKPGELASVSGTLNPRLAREMTRAVRKLCEEIEPLDDAKS